MSKSYFGMVTRVKFSSPEDSWYVLSMRLSGSMVDRSVVGNIIGIDVEQGAWFGFTADEIKDPKWGDQLKITRAPYFPPNPADDQVENVLNGQGISFRIISHVKKYASKGGMHLHDLLTRPDELQKIPGLDKFAAKLIHDKWARILSFGFYMDSMANLRIPPKKMNVIMTALGDEIESVLQEDPWRLCAFGLTFDECDNIAVVNKIPLDCSKRWRAAILKAMSIARDHGNLYSIPSDVSRECARIMSSHYSLERFKKEVEFAKQDREVFIEKKDSKTCIYEPWCYQVESISAQIVAEKSKLPIASFIDKQFLVRLSNIGPNTFSMINGNDYDISKIREYAKLASEEWKGSITLHGKQVDGAVNALSCPISVITGLPGTGKTSLLKTVVKLLQEAGESPLLVAPTGMAAKRLSHATGYPAATIHRALGAKGTLDEKESESSYIGILSTAHSQVPEDIGMIWGHGPHNPHETNFVIIDEASMLDQHLFWRLLTSTKKECRFLLVGDAAQLPSVGPGDVLHELINSETIPCVHLNKIFRQDEASGIVKAAHAIDNGDFPELSAPSGDFVLIETNDESKVLSMARKVIGRLWENNQSKGISVDAQKSFQVISPRHKGTVGVTNLNAALREVINPEHDGRKEIQSKGATIREGDRVTIVKNNYKLGVFNGDFGKVSRIDRNRKEVVVKIHGPQPSFVNFSIKNISQYLRLAYAVTVHRSQGQEFDIVVIPIVNSFGRQLKRNLIYTAITRAKAKVILIGTSSALAKAISRNDLENRRTMFKHRIDEYARKRSKDTSE